MANDRTDRNDNQSERGTNRDRVIGKGMTSPDSTQVPLKATTGEPDEDAIHGRVPRDSGSDSDGSSSDRQSSRR